MASYISTRSSPQPSPYRPKVSSIPSDAAASANIIAASSAANRPANTSNTKTLFTHPHTGLPLNFYLFPELKTDNLTHLIAKYGGILLTQINPSLNPIILCDSQSIDKISPNSLLNISTIHSDSLVYTSVRRKRLQPFQDYQYQVLIDPATGRATAKHVNSGRNTSNFTHPSAISGSPAPNKPTPVTPAFRKSFGSASIHSSPAINFNLERSFGSPKRPEALNNNATPTFGANIAGNYSLHSTPRPQPSLAQKPIDLSFGGSISALQLATKQTTEVVIHALIISNGNFAAAYDYLTGKQRSSSIFSAEKDFSRPWSVEEDETLLSRQSQLLQSLLAQRSVAECKARLLWLRSKITANNAGNEQDTGFGAENNSFYGGEAQQGQRRFSVSSVRHERRSRPSSVAAEVAASHSGNKRSRLA
jgi:hypothetical protein